MDRFLHTSIRLNTDLGRATRFFSQADQMARWLCCRAEAAPDGTSMRLIGVCDPEDRWQWDFTEIRREQVIRVNCDGFLQPEGGQQFELEIQLMKCTSLTEYCSEIHVIQRSFESTEDGDGQRSKYEELWRVKLDALRTLVNGKWIIEDKDLTLDIFK